MLLYIFFSFTIIAALNETPVLSELKANLQNDFWIFTLVWRQNMAADFLNHGFICRSFSGIYLKVFTT